MIGLPGEAELAAIPWDLGWFSTLYPGQVFSNTAGTAAAANGSAVAHWRNRSGGTLGNLVQATANYQPTFRKGDAANSHRGLPCVDFQVDDLLGATFTSRALTTWSMYAILEIPQQNSWAKWFSIETALGTAKFKGYWTLGAYSESGGACLIEKDGVGSLELAPLPADGAYVVLEWHYNSTARDARINAIVPVGNGMTSGSISWTGITLGALRDGSLNISEPIPRMKVVEWLMSSDPAAYDEAPTIRKALRARAWLNSGFEHF